MSPSVDYSLYLVTDSSLVPEGLTLVEQVQKAVAGGVTIVQLREKTADTRDFVELAKQVKAITQKAGIPLIINDRVDVALAVDAEGVHVGQEDMDIPTLRRLLGPSKIIGLSVSNVDEARDAVKQDIDYVGIGAIYGTQTKVLKKQPMGFSGVRKILRVFEEERPELSTVAIGGINHTNARAVMEVARIPGKMLDGLAVVSCIIGSSEAEEASKKLWGSVRLALLNRSFSASFSAEAIRNQAPKIVADIASEGPFVHHITNSVVRNFSANITLAVGGSPAMSESVEEFDEFSLIPNCALLLNMGTATVEGVRCFQEAVKAYNQSGTSIVFDPVGAGASTHRRQVTATLLNTGRFSVIKGNEGEITSAAGVQGAKMRGVDSVGESDILSRTVAAARLSQDNSTVVLMTGKQDILVDYSRHRAPRGLVFSNGHEYLGKITGSGCVLGSIVAAFVAVHCDICFEAAAAGLMLYTIAAERAAARPSVEGPGTFVPALIDEIYAISQESAAGNWAWIKHAKVDILQDVSEQLKSL